MASKSHHSMHNYEQQLFESWETNAAAWRQTIDKGLIASRQLGTNEAVVKAVLATQPLHVLDVGCGEGWLCRKLAGAGVRATGIDGSEELIEAAKQKGAATYAVLSYEQLINDFTQPAGPFDCMVCNFSLLGHNLAPLLGALRKKLSHGGKLIVQTVHPFTACGSEPYADGWRMETFSGFEEVFPANMPWYFRTLASWVAEITCAGYAIEAIEEPSHPQTGRPLSLIIVAKK